MEIWVNISESKNCMISSYGKVKRLSYQIVTTNGAGNIPHITTVPEKILGGSKLSQKGYLRVNLNNKTYFIHRLVAKYFIPNPNNKSQINHIDGNKLNNNVNNLEWVSNLENRKHAVRTGLHKGPDPKLSTKQLIEITTLYDIGMTQKEIGRLYKVSQQVISKAIQKLRNKYSTS
jgi:hypothetical protein